MGRTDSLTLSQRNHGVARRLYAARTAGSYDDVQGGTRSFSAMSVAHLGFLRRGATSPCPKVSTCSPCIVMFTLTSAVILAMTFTSDFKLGHYMKIPPRPMFWSQVRRRGITCVDVPMTQRVFLDHRDHCRRNRAARRRELVSVIFRRRGPPRLTPPPRRIFSNVP